MSERASVAAPPSAAVGRRTRSKGATAMGVIRDTRSARSLSSQAAAALVRPGDWVDYGAVLAQPDVFDTALAARVDELHGVSIRGCLSLHPRAVLEADPEREHFAFYNWHLS